MNLALCNDLRLGFECKSVSANTRHIRPLSPSLSLSLPLCPLHFSPPLSLPPRPSQPPGWTQTRTCSCSLMWSACSSSSAKASALPLDILRSTEETRGSFDPLTKNGILIRGSRGGYKGSAPISRWYKCFPFYFSSSTKSEKSTLQNGDSCTPLVIRPEKDTVQPCLLLGSRVQYQTNFDVRRPIAVEYTSNDFVILFFTLLLDVYTRTHPKLHTEMTTQDSPISPKIHLYQGLKMRPFQTRGQESTPHGLHCQLGVTRAAGGCSLPSDSDQTPGLRL